MGIAVGEEEKANRSRSVVVLSSTDDDEDREVVVVPSSSDDDVVVRILVGDGRGIVGGNRKKKKLKRTASNKTTTTAAKKKMSAASDGGGGEALSADELNATSCSVVTEANGVSDNLILRKLLRCPRYFDQELGNLQTCYRCGEEGHIAANCTLEKQKPCFVCGLFGHNAKSCSQKCFICNKRGHFAKECPNRGCRPSRVCLRCGHSGHDMSSCTCDYAPEDLKEIQCYVCNKFGHLCCAEIEDTNAGTVSCYNCGLVGHTGLGCAKSRGETSGSGSPLLCHVCGEEGHFARGCTQKKKLVRYRTESSTTPGPKCKREKKLGGSKSLPRDVGQSSKKKKHLQRDNWDVSPRKSGARYGWNVDDQGDLSTYDAAKDKGKAKVPSGSLHRKSRVRGEWMVDNAECGARNKSWNPGWRSPATPFIPSRNSLSLASEGWHPNSQPPHWKYSPYSRTNSFGCGNGQDHYYGSGSRYSSPSNDRFWRR